MDYEKTRVLIKELRNKKNMSQEQLAEKLFCDRTMINKIENGTRFLSIDELILLSKALDVSLEELVAGEMKQKNNTEIINNKFYEYLKTQNTKFKKLRLSVYILIIMMIFCFVGFTIFYFFHNYGSIRVYNFYGNSEKYEITDGLLVMSKRKIYFKINEINPEESKIIIESEIDGKRKKVYEGDSNVVLNDFYGYSAFIDYDSFINGKQKIFVVINGEEIELIFEEDFVNDGFFYRKEDKISEEKNRDEKKSFSKINELFTCKKGEGCFLEQEGEIIIFNNNILTVMTENNNYIYDIDNEILDYQDNIDSQKNVSINAKEDTLVCVSGDCNNKENIYNEFKKNYILKYLK